MTPPPLAGGFGYRDCTWDIMGYHGNSWASMERRPPPTPARLALIRRLNRPLAPPGLKEWLKAAGRIGPGGSPSPSSTLSALLGPTPLMRLIKRHAMRVSPHLKRKKWCT